VENKIPQALVENKTGSNQWWKIKPLVENKTTQTKNLPLVENKNKFYNSLAINYTEVCTFTSH
jgi:hypothetical protein